MGDEDSVDCTPVEFVEERKGSHSRECWVDSCVANDRSSLVLDDAA